jgi:hypothetical protein
MPQTEFITELSQYMYDLVYNNRLILGFEDVYDGEQDLIPRTPACLIVMGEYTREYTGAPFRTDNTFTVFLMLYHEKIQDTQLNQRECMEQAEQLMLFLHQDLTMGGLVINGFVSNIEPGYIKSGKSMTYVSRLTWTAFTKTMIDTTP